MFVVPWWALLGIILVLLYLVMRMVDLTRRSKKLRDIVRKLEGVQNTEQEDNDSDRGGFEG